MNRQPLVVAGIGTDVGKTVASAVLCRILCADYWKPVASGTDDGPVDHQIMEALIDTRSCQIQSPAYVFGKSLSPHVAAALEGRAIDMQALVDSVPITKNRLVIELAGGVLVPLSDTCTNIDLLEQWLFPTIIVSRHYLGSINHTLLTVEALRSRNVPIAGIIFNGEELPDTERIIQKLSDAPILGRIPLLTAVTASTVQSIADAQMVRIPETL